MPFQVHETEAELRVSIPLHCCNGKTFLRLVITRAGSIQKHAGMTALGFGVCLRCAVDIKAPCFTTLIPMSVLNHGYDGCSYSGLLVRLEQVATHARVLGLARAASARAGWGPSKEPRSRSRGRGSVCVIHHQV